MGGFNLWGALENDAIQCRQFSQDFVLTHTEQRALGRDKGRFSGWPLVGGT